MYYQNKKCNRKCSMCENLITRKHRYFFSLFFSSLFHSRFLFSSSNRTVTHRFVVARHMALVGRYFFEKNRSSTVKTATPIYHGSSHAPHLGLIDFQWPSNDSFERRWKLVNDSVTIYRNQLSIICRRKK